MSTEAPLRPAHKDGSVRRYVLDCVSPRDPSSCRQILNIVGQLGLRLLLYAALVRSASSTFCTSRPPMNHHLQPYRTKRSQANPIQFTHIFHTHASRSDNHLGENPGVYRTAYMTSDPPQRSAPARELHRIPTARTALPRQALQWKTNTMV
jgi:hypothetical protein